MSRPVAILLLWVVSLAPQTVAIAEVSGAVAEVPADSTSPATLEPVTVLLSSGRVFVAEIDVRTDESDLWLRWRQGGVSLFRPIRWDRVTQVEVAGRTFSGDAVRDAVVALRPNAPDVGETDVESITSPEVLLIGPSPANAAAAEPATEPRPRPALVNSLSIDADADNFDGDGDVDGLVVTIRPRDERGELRPVSGTLEVRLLGPRPLGREGSVLLARWTQRVLPSDFDTAEATYRLRYPTGGPRFGREAHLYAEVAARLVVPGEGVFEAIAPMVRLWPHRVVHERRRW
jgi:hypothetical protein